MLMPKRPKFHVSNLKLLVAPIVFFVTLLIPLNLPSEAHRFLALFLFTICQWFLTDVPLFATGIFSVSLSVLLGVAPAKEAFSSFSDPLIFLFLGGFLLAKSMEKLSFDKKICFYLISHPLVKGSLKRTIFALYFLTATFSMWISNTATTAMMIPITLGILTGLDIKDLQIRTKILIGMAYSATIGGLGTPIGSPPNLLGISMLKKYAGIDFSFLHWTFSVFPLVLIILTFLYFFTTRTMEEQNFELEKLKIYDDFKNMPSVNTNDRLVIGIFFLTVFFWFLPGISSLFLSKESSILIFFKSTLNPGVISIFFSGLLFFFPLSGEKEKVLTSQDIREVDWSTLLLFGAGLSLGQTLFKTGLANYFAEQIIQLANNSGISFLTCALAIGTIFFTEFTSNTASANILIPITIATAKNLEASPLVPAIIVAISCNLAFMLPISTPPNAIIYGSGQVKIKDMAKFGIVMNSFCILILCLGVIIFT